MSRSSLRYAPEPRPPEHVRRGVFPAEAAGIDLSMEVDIWDVFGCKSQYKAKYGQVQSALNCGGLPAPPDLPLPGYEAAGNRSGLISEERIAGTNFKGVLGSLDDADRRWG